VCDQAGVSPFDLAQTWGDWCLLVAVAAADVDTALAKLAADSIAAQEIGMFVRPSDGITVGASGERVPWRGVAQERFTDRSWHGDDDLGRWMADLVRGTV
jgi:thiamine-monophosphate kinase